MIAPARPANEDQRLQTLNQLDIFNEKTEARFDRITRVLAALFDVPIAMVNLIGADTQLTKACFGLPNNKIMDRDTSFCGHTILSDKVLVINNALQDERFKDNPEVIGGLHIRAYAGVPLQAVDGTRPGALCLIDTEPREFTETQINLLIDLSAWAEIELNSSQLREALDQNKVSQANVESQLLETKRLNDLMIGRELKMIEMKKQVEDLTAKLQSH